MPPHLTSSKKMNLSECGLRLHVTEDDGDVLLRFSQVTLGFNGYLCTIRKRTGAPLFDTRKNESPDRFTRAIFRLIHGLKEFREEYSLRSDDSDQECIRFFKCSDRHGRTRTFVSATERPGLEAGGSFITNERDFENVLRRLNQGEQGGDGDAENSV